jgi:Zn-dependent peptidase ImmA (M78 family)
MENEMSVLARHLSSAPVNLKAIFDDLGILYRETPIKTGESGWIERSGERFEVVVNSNDPLTRRRFTAAHELAHYLLHRDLMDHGARAMRHIDRLYGDPVDNPASPLQRHHEVQANRMAARIIMPAELVRERHAQNPNYVALASDFEVSPQAMEIRLKTLRLA